jgi:hypothetical protein
MKDEKRGRECRGGECSEEERARAPDELAPLGEDLRPVGLDAMVARQSAQSAVEFPRLIHELLETRRPMVSVTRNASFAPAPSTASSGAITSASNSTSVAIAASA